MRMELVWPLGAAAAAVAAMMCLVFVFARRIRNYGVVDVAWSWAFIPVTGIYALLMEGDPSRQALVLTLVCGWSGRLGWHLYRRVAHEHPKEDGRYAQLRVEWGDATHARMFWFYQLQGIVLTALSLPFLLIAANPTPTLVPVEWMGATLVLVALTGEAVADWQLDRFKADPSNRGRTCRRGLWGFSRHPNYFFEWLVWVGFFLAALGSPGGVFSVGSPSLILYFLLTKTGIPATEEQALRSRGDDYREYQRTTSAFVPWFRKTQP